MKHEFTVLFDKAKKIQPGSQVEIITAWEQNTSKNWWHIYGLKMNGSTLVKLPGAAAAAKKKPTTTAARSKPSTAKKKPAKPAAQYGAGNQSRISALDPLGRTNDHHQQQQQPLRTERFRILAGARTPAFHGPGVVWRQRTADTLHHGPSIWTGLTGD